MKFTYPNNTGISYSLCVSVQFSYPFCSLTRVFSQHKHGLLRRSAISIHGERVQPLMYSGHHLLATWDIWVEQEWVDHAVSFWLGRTDTSARSLRGGDQHHHILRSTGESTSLEGDIARYCQTSSFRFQRGSRRPMLPFALRHCSSKG
jgi:hypothetical protein